MTERTMQFTNGSGNSVAGNGGTATTNNYYGDRFAPQPARSARGVYLDPFLPGFIGRGSELAALHALLSREGGVAYIPGQPGRGKSTLANHYAHLHKDEYQSIHLLPCHSKSVAEIAAELAWQLDLKLDGDLDSNLRQLRAHCARNRCLLLLDNVDDEAPAGMLLGGRSSVVLTTWHTNLKFLRPFHPVRLSDFTEDQCFELFHAKLDAKLGVAHVDRHADECRLLFHRLEFHPKAIDLAAHLIREVQQYTIAGMAKNLPKDIPALFDEAVAALSPNARALLAAMAACAPEGFRLSLAAEIAGFDEDTAFLALNELCSRSLADELDRDTHRYRLHTLVRDAAQPADEHRSRHVEAVLTQFESWETNWRRCEEDLADWRTAFNWTLNQPGESAWSVNINLAFIGYSLAVRIGRIAEAHEICVSISESTIKRGDNLCFQAWLGNQALILKDWGRLGEAMTLLEQQEALCVKLDYKLGLSTCYGNQALIYKVWGQLERAMALHKLEEALCDELGNKAALSRCYGNQAPILTDFGQLDDAMALLKLQELLCVELGDKAGLAVSYGNQAVILNAWEQLDEAMALFKREEALCDETGNKAGLQRTFGNQAVILKKWGQLNEAMALRKQEEDLAYELGDKGGLGRSYGNQATIFYEWKRLDTAMTLIKQQETLCVELDDKTGLAVCYVNQGVLALEQGDKETGRKKIQQAHDLFKEIGMPREVEKAQSLLSEANALSDYISS